jgi:hypothetical protein
MNKITPSLKSVLTTGLVKGFKYSCICFVITNGLYAVFLSITAIISTPNVFGKQSFFVLIALTILRLIMHISGYTMLLFIYFGLPLLVLPFIFGSTMLSYWLYKDFTNQSFSSFKARTKGITIGSLSGLIPVLVLFINNPIWRINLDLFVLQRIAIDFLPGIVVLLGISGGIAGFILTIELTDKLT